MSFTSPTNAALRTICLISLLFAAASALGATARRVTIIQEPGRVPAPLPLPLPLQLRVWQCRQRCYQQMLLPPSSSPGLCHARPDCYMCHDYCRVLVVAEWSLARSMCADRIFCSRGCRTACQFHQLHTAQAAPFANALNKA